MEALTFGSWGEVLCRILVRIRRAFWSGGTCLLLVVVPAAAGSQPGAPGGVSGPATFFPAGRPITPVMRQADTGQRQDRSYLTRPGDTYWGIARRFGLNLPELMAANASYAPRRLPVGVRLRLPEANPDPPRRPKFNWPVSGWVTSRYGWRWGRMHRGLDIAAPAGTTIRAAAAGRVIFAGWRAGYGLYVVLDHEGEWRTAYAHHSRIYVRRGDWVPSGGPLARIGTTGRSTGIHLHFEVTTPRGRVNPLDLL